MACQRAIRGVGLLRVRLLGASRTLLGPLYERAADARRALPLLGDRAALDLVARLDHDFSWFENRPPSFTSVVRTRVFDDITRSFLNDHPGGTVVELGAGLNTRFERLDNDRQRWFDLDLPEVTALRRALLPSNARRWHVAASVVEPSWLELVATAPAPYCFLLEAMLGYVPCDQVRGVLGRIARRFPGATIALDPPSWWTLVDGQLARSEHPGSLSAIDLPRAMEAWQIGLNLVDTTTFFGAKHRERAPPVRRLHHAQMIQRPYLVARFRTDDSVGAAASSG
jgi:O-methyltransferase involved in polyketide biosynthesis